MHIVKHKIKKDYMDLILSGKKEWEIRKYDNEKHSINPDALIGNLLLQLADALFGEVQLQLEVIETKEIYIFKTLACTSLNLEFWEINLFFPHIDSIKDIKKKLHDCGIDRDSKIVYFHIEERIK